ncbi:MAG: hypothetical protein ABH875_03530 [Candidatus Omnitrophota bacterium]
MQKIRYETDPHNRLVVKETGKKADVSRFRRVLDGKFKTGPGNSLIYHIKDPAEIKGTGPRIPHQIRLKGRWSLTDDHDLRLTLDKRGRQTFGDELVFQGEILDADRNELAFAIATKSKDNIQTTYVIKLEGAWQADKNNRLNFKVKRERQRYDILTFTGAWDIGKNYHITYQYQRSHLIRKRKKTHTITFSGHWNITERAKILYELEGDSRSVFNFITSLGIYEKHSIKYEIGIVLSGKRKEEKRTLALFGRWAIKKGVGVIFEVRYEGKEVQRIVFGAEARLTKRDTISLKLLNENRADTGIEIELSHIMLKGGGRAFLRLLKSQKEAAIYAGAACRW